MYWKIVAGENISSLFIDSLINLFFNDFHRITNGLFVYILTGVSSFVSMKRIYLLNVLLVYGFIY